MSEPVKFDSAGIRAALNTAEMRAVVKDAAEDIAANVREQHILVGPFAGQQGTSVDADGSQQIELPVKVVETRTDRAHAEVVLAHPAGIAAQAKYGALTKAAAEKGLQVHG